MQLLTPEDMDQLISVTAGRVNYLELIGPVCQGVVDHRLDTTNVKAFHARLVATKEYLSRVEFATPDEIAAARDTHYDEDGNFAVDDNARVSRCDDGECWVEAWVLIGKKQ